MGNLKYTFKDRNVLVTGGARGIGFEITKAFLESGATVTIADFSQPALEMARRELSTFSGLNAVSLNVTDRESCAKMAASLSRPINILINNAGITRDKSFAKMSDEDFDQVVHTNLTGVYNVTKCVLEKFDPGLPKRIINIASVVALYGNFGQTNYVASKAGVIGMSKTWARELAKKGFTVNAIAPGFIRTKMTEAMPQTVLNEIAAKVPINRLGEPFDIANTCLFLASDEASYINSVVLSVDGGLVI